jgi:hypothetical protein
MRLVIALVLMIAMPPIGAAEPDIYLLGYQSYIPDKRFSNIRGGPDHYLMAIVGTESEWRALWTSMEPRMSWEMGHMQPYPLPKIDFAQYALVVAALGETSDGHSVSIQQIQVFGPIIHVGVIALSSGSGCVSLNERIHPVALALIQRSEKKVQFDVRNIVIPCDGKCPQSPPNQRLERP